MRKRKTLLGALRPKTLQNLDHGRPDKTEVPDWRGMSSNGHLMLGGTQVCDVCKRGGVGVQSGGSKVYPLGCDAGSVVADI